MGYTSIGNMSRPTYTLSESLSCGWVKHSPRSGQDFKILTRLPSTSFHRNPENPEWQILFWNLQIKSCEILTVLPTWFRYNFLWNSNSISYEIFTRWSFFFTGIPLKSRHDQFSDEMPISFEIKKKKSFGIPTRFPPDSGQDYFRNPDTILISTGFPEKQRPRNIEIIFVKIPTGSPSIFRQDFRQSALSWQNFR